MLNDFSYSSAIVGLSTRRGDNVSKHFPNSQGENKLKKLEVKKEG